MKTRLGSFSCVLQWVLDVNLLTFPFITPRAKYVANVTYLNYDESGQGPSSEQRDKKQGEIGLISRWFRVKPSLDHTGFYLICPLGGLSLFQKSLKIIMVALERAACGHAPPVSRIRTSSSVGCLIAEERLLIRCRFGESIRYLPRCGRGGKDDEKEQGSQRNDYCTIDSEHDFHAVFRGHSQGICYHVML